jgi:pimeloyl-ACP methyl ester carboxylesterase
LDSREWRHQLEGLSDEFTVVAWDMPGCGFSDDPPDGFGSRDYADLLAAFIERLGLETPHVLGLSLGSLLALELYHWHGDVPRSLILASAYAGWAGSLPAGVAEQRRQKIARMIEAPAGEWVREWLPTLLGKQASDEVAQEVRAIMADFHPEGQRRLLQSGFAEIDLRDVLSQLDVPTLLLYGEVDVRSPREVAETMHVRIRGSQLVFMPGVGHLGDMEAPQLFNAEVRRFLGSIG